MLQPRKTKELKKEGCANFRRPKLPKLVGFQVLTAVVMMNAIFWNNRERDLYLGPLPKERRIC
jgi:hypothetical protein